MRRNDFMQILKDFELKKYLTESEIDNEIVFWLLIRFLMDSKLTPGLTYYTNEAGEPCYSLANYEGVFSIPTNEFINELQTASPNDFLGVAIEWYKSEILK